MWIFNRKYSEPKRESDPGGQRFSARHLAAVRRFHVFWNGEEIIFNLTKGNSIWQSLNASR